MSAIFRVPEGPGYHRRNLWSLKAVFFFHTFLSIEKAKGALL